MIDAKCQVEQAQTLLSVWLEAAVSDDLTTNMIGALMTLLEGVPLSMNEAEEELGSYQFKGALS
nr:hypothetical protein [Rosenbergiella epipactidis]